jgi:hypothetical protein
LAGGNSWRRALSFGAFEFLVRATELFFASSEVAIGVENRGLEFASPLLIGLDGTPQPSDLFSG